MEHFFKKRWLRWLLYTLTGVLVKFLLDASYSLMFRNYALSQPLLDYLYAITLSITTLEIVHQIRTSLTRGKKWYDQPYKRFVLQWVLSLFAALFIVFIMRWLYTLVMSSVYYVRVVDEVVLAIFVFFVISGMVLIELGVYMLEKWRFSLAELERFKKENAEFQFESLRAQVNPHFLFNSLNTLSSLVYESQEKAESFIRELSDVYRYILENRGKELVSLGEELKVARSYIYLVQLRFDQNLHIELDIQSNAYSMRIAPLTLQLLIENAVKHNIISSRKPLNVSIALENGYILVRNNLQKKMTREYSSEMGLKNIRSRYTFLTDDQMIVDETENEFIVKIPLIKPE